MPTVAVASGRTLGAGADLFAACDRRIALTGASFAFPGPGFGLVLGTGRLAALLGRDAARHVLLSGAELPAEAALEAGLATALLAPGRTLIGGGGLTALGVLLTVAFVAHREHLRIRPHLHPPALTVHAG